MQHESGGAHRMVPCLLVVRDITAHRPSINGPFVDIVPLLIISKGEWQAEQTETHERVE